MIIPQPPFAQDTIMVQPAFLNSRRRQRVFPDQLHLVDHSLRG